MQEPSNNAIWVAAIGSVTSVLLAIIGGIVAYKTKQKTDEIGTKVDGAATAADVKMEAMRVEIARLNEARVVLASAAVPAIPAPGEPVVAAVGTAMGKAIPVVIADAIKPVPVDVVVKQERESEK